MYISNISNPIQLYKNTATLDGAINLTSKGVFGQGVLVTKVLRQNRTMHLKNKA
jgi:hypothetical protein